MSEAAGSSQSPPKKRGRPKTRPDTLPANVVAPSRSADGPLEEQARRNLTGAFQLGGRLMGSAYRVTEEEFEEVGRGVANIARDYPAAAPVIRDIIRALGPAATAADLVEKFNRLFSGSKLKEKVDKQRAGWRPPWHREEVPPAPDQSSGL